MQKNLKTIKCLVQNMVRNANNFKSYLQYTRGITLKRVTSGGVHLRGLVPVDNTETTQRWRAVGDTVFDLTYSGIEPLFPRTDSDVSLSRDIQQFIREKQFRPKIREHDSC